MNKDTLDIQELLDLIDQTEQVSPEEKRKNLLYDDNHTKLFIKSFGIEDGDNKVPNYVIYYHFCKYSQGKRRNPTGKTHFFRTFNQYFQAKRNGKQRFYMINGALDNSEETQKAAKIHQSKYQKTKKEKQRDLSSTRKKQS